ncbi:MAG: CTP synthase [Clostridia bacterium]|nr:CTP synthase [Clostridia bacterium]
MTKFVFVTGGVVSGLGKGITVASLGMLLKSRKLKVTAQKLDPYINVDPGTMSPYQHGEVFVTDDGTETDLDLGHYERFMDENLNKFSNITSGQIYWQVLAKERKGEYLGKTVQVIPHITNEIKNFIYSLSNNTKADVIITEIGGTVGDIEILPFVEAARQIFMEVGKQNCLFIHLTLVPYLPASGEYKTKPTQHSVKELRSLGINPDVIIARCEKNLDNAIKEKIALFCSVKSDCVIENLSMPSLYEVPLMLEKSSFSDIVVRELEIKCQNTNLTDWQNITKNINKNNKIIKIAIVGKYIGFKDAYLSVIEALNHAGIFWKVNIQIEWVNAELLTEFTVKDMLKDCQGILVPGGFDSRGVSGMITAAKYARENNIAYFGICLGMQIAVIEFARHVLNIPDADSAEFSETCTPVINLMQNQKDIEEKGATMRLGAYTCKIKDNTKLQEIYKTDEISERHRHRYEFNNNFREKFENNGMVISGLSPDGVLVEVIEIPAHKFYIGVQFHPEFKSRPNKVQPIFREFIKTCIN